MLDALLPFLESVSSSLVYPQWTQYVSTIENKKVQCQARLMSLRQLTVHKGTQLLLDFLRRWRPDELCLLGDDFYIYRTQADDLCNSVVKSNVGGLYYYNFFTMAQSSIVDHLLFPLDNDVLRRAPLGRNYGVWRDYHPFRLYYHDSLEQTLDMYSAGGIVRFHDYPPTYTVWTLDLKGMLLKAVVYMREYKKGPEDYLTFIKEGLYDCILDDLLLIWYFNVQNHAVRISLGETSLEAVTSLYQRQEGPSGYIGGQFAYMIKVMVDLYNKIRDRLVKPEDCFSMPLIGHISMKTWIKTRDRLSSHLQDKVYRLVRDLPYLEYILRVFSLVPESTSTRTVKEIVKRELYRWMLGTPLSYVHPDSLRLFIKDRLSRIDRYVTSTDPYLHL